MRSCALLLLALAGCFDVTPNDSTVIGGYCGDGVCSPDESGLSCPFDCATPGPASHCGDGICEPGESPATCPADCGALPPPPPVCSETALTGATIDIMGSTVGAPAAEDTTSCGVANSAPAITYSWTAPSTGRYTIGATASFPIVVAIDSYDCNGDELACTTSPAKTLALSANQTIAIDITSTGAAGAFELRIDRLADACGDGVCEASESSATCPADCGAPSVCGDGVCAADESSATCPADCSTTTTTTGPICGDGVCDAGETCPIDCDTTTTGPVCGDGVCDAGETCDADCGSSTSSYCGDGSCDGGEDSDSCPSDCGEPSCDPSDPDCF